MKGQCLPPKKAGETTRVVSTVEEEVAKETEVGEAIWLMVVEVLNLHGETSTTGFWHELGIEVTFVIDTGAEVHVLSVDVLRPWLSVAKVTNSGSVLRGASGDQLKSLGGVQVRLDVASRTIALEAEVAEIKHCVLSVACLQRTGWSARFGDEGCELRRDTFGIPLRRRGNLYVLEAKLKQLLCDEAPAVMPVGQEVVEGEQREGVVDEDVPAPREIPLPSAPSATERQQHELTHLPPRTRCASCCLARARHDPYVVPPPEVAVTSEVEGEDLIQSDYMYFDNIKVLTVWVATKQFWRSDGGRPKGSKSICD